MTWRTRPVGESRGHPSAPAAAPAPDAVSADTRSEELLTGPARCSELQAGKAASSARLNFRPELTALPSWALPDSTQTTLRKRIDDRSATKFYGAPSGPLPLSGRPSGDRCRAVAATPRAETPRSLRRGTA